MPTNPVVWFEIYVQDMPRAKAFYEAVLGQTLEPLPAPEGDGADGTLEMLTFPGDMHGGGANGALVRMEGVGSAGEGMGTMVYFHCDDCAIPAGRVVEAGGRLHKEKMSIGQYGHIALAWDTEGNMIGFHSMA